MFSKFSQCLSLRSATLLAGFQSELTARKDAITAAKADCEASYAATLSKSDADIQKNPTLMSTITTNLAKMDSAFTSFNGTIKSIKLAIDSR